MCLRDNNPSKDQKTDEGQQWALNTTRKLQKNFSIPIKKTCLSKISFDINVPQNGQFS